MPHGHYVLVIHRTVYRGVPEEDIAIIETALEANADEVTFRSDAGVQQAPIAGISVGWYEETDVSDVG